MSQHIRIDKPLPVTELPYQNGIANPRYRLLPPEGLQQAGDYDLYKGLVDKQGYLALIRADVLTYDRDELKALLRILSDYTREAMEKTPSTSHLLPLEYGNVPQSYRVTVTIGFGVTLFTDRSGFDRFGLNFRKPQQLKLIPPFPGDHFDPAECASDLIIQVASDHPYVNVAVTRYFAEYINKAFFRQTGRTDGKPVFRVRDIQQGFGRPDLREFLRFNDGIDNLRAGIDLERLVFVDDLTGEPDWCFGGSYMVYRKIQEMMPVWEAFATKDQEKIIGREKATGLPLSRQKTGTGNLTPVYPDPTNDADGPLNAHIRKVQPRRTGPDLFGIEDLERRFLRRPYPFFDGVGPDGNTINGLHFVAFMKSIQQQFEHVVNMWQMNPDFPKPGTGIDALYAKGVLRTISAGYYFCPPAAISADDFIGSGLFKEPEKPNYAVPRAVYGYGITFIDIDETVFNTFSFIKVMKDGKEVRRLDNQQFNEDKLQEGESYDFGEFRNAQLFLNTSRPIVPIIERIKKILHLITANSQGSRIVFLTARSDFDDKETFLNTFRKYGIDIDSDRMYVERTGNLKEGTVAEKKKQVVLRYLSGGEYRRVRLLDDNKENLKGFLSIKASIPDSLLQKIRELHQLDAATYPISFFAYLVGSDGGLTLSEE